MKTTFEIQPIPGMKFGDGVMDNLEDDLVRMGADAPLLIIDKQMQEQGLTRKVEKQLAESSLDVRVHVIREPVLSIACINILLESVQLDQMNGIVAFGGWRCTDLAKIASIFATNDLSADDISRESITITRHGLPVVSIPTTPPNGAEVDTKIFVRDDRSKRLHTLESPFLAPRLTIIDPMLMTTLPSDLTAATGIDSLSHAVDALISINASPFSELLALQSIALLKENLVDAFRKPENLRARYNIALGSLYSALALNMTGSGLTHALAYPLTARYGISHPQASSLMSLHAMRFNLAVVPNQFSRIARLMGCRIQGDESDASKAIAAFEELFSFLDVPIHLSSYRIPGIDIQELSAFAMNYSGCIEANPRILTAREIQAIYHNAL